MRKGRRERERENEKQERKGVGGGWTKKEVGRRKGQRFWHPAESPNCLAILPSKRPARPWTLSSPSPPPNSALKAYRDPEHLLLLLLPPLSLRPSRSFSSSTTPFSSTRTLNKQHHLSHCAKRYICFRRTCLIIYIQPPSGTRLLTSSPLPSLSSLPSSGTVSFPLSSLEIRKRERLSLPRYRLSIFSFIRFLLTSSIRKFARKRKKERRTENWKERLRARETNYQGGMPVLESVMKFDLAIGTTR